MFQKEVADRILAKCKSPYYGRLSIITRSRLQVVDSFNVPTNCFFPKPKVESTVLTFTPKKNYVKFKKLVDLILKNYWMMKARLL